MKFLSGTRNRRITYVVIPSRPVMDMTTGRTTVTPAIRAKFIDHKFNSSSEEMKATYKDYCREVSTGEKKITPEEMEKVVDEYLINHSDFGRSDGRGIFLDSTATLSEVELQAKGVRRRCSFMQDIGDETVGCEQFVEDPESDYCTEHKPIVEAAVAAAAGAAKE